MPSIRTPLPRILVAASLTLLAVALLGGRLRGPVGGAAPAAAISWAEPPTRSPIKHVVVILKENRSFDQYFGKFKGANGATEGTMSDGTTVQLGPTPEPLPNDIAHNKQAWRVAYNHGAMDGFDKEPGAISRKTGQNLAYTQMSESQIPNYWQYARNYAIGDNVFAPWKGNSFANNIFVLAAQAGQYDPNTGFRSVSGNPSKRTRFWWGCDDPPDSFVWMVDPATGDLGKSFPCFTFKALPQVLADEGIPWKLYSDFQDVSNHHNALDAIHGVRYDPNLWGQVQPIANFGADVDAGAMPAVSWIVPTRTDHAPDTACFGENWLVSKVNRIMQSPYWDSTAIFVIWDEWGGFYDHVPPPNLGDRISYGFRVPLLVISPWTKYNTNPQSDGFVDKDFMSHPSLLKFIEWNWGITDKHLTPRDDPSSDIGNMVSFFDWSQTPKDPLVLQPHDCRALSAAQLRMLAGQDPD